jgi:hypothetical protein
MSFAFWPKWPPSAALWTSLRLPSSLCTFTLSSARLNSGPTHRFHSGIQHLEATGHFRKELFFNSTRTFCSVFLLMVLFCQQSSGSQIVFWAIAILFYHTNIFVKPWPHFEYCPILTLQCTCTQLGSPS